MRSLSLGKQSILAAARHAAPRLDVDLEIRVYRPADDLACRRIAAQAALSSYGARMPHLQHLFREERALEPADLRLVGLARGQVAGFVDLVGSHVANLFVDPAAQGRGIGARLLAEAEARIVGDVTLSVFTVNSAARRLYERLGYRVEEDGVASFGGSLEPVWRMRKTRGAPPFPLVVFDFDGTLADSAEWFIRSLNGVARRYGFREASAEEIEALRGAPTREVLRRLRVPMWRLPAIARHMRGLARRDASAIRLFPGVEELLAALDAAGVQTAIVSSNAEDTVRRILGDQASQRIHRFACGASLFGKAAKIRGLIRSSGLAASRVLCIGDETRDVEAAHASGARAGAVAWGYARPEALERALPDFLVHSIHDLRESLAAV